MNAIIVDDEPKAIELLKSYLEHFKSIQLVATFRNGLKAFEYISNHSIDLVFLDINMPHLAGTSLAKMLDPKTKIIFTTAYSEFAVESYDVEATDYLLKPISFERFTKAIAKILKNNLTGQKNDQKFIFVKSGNKTHRIKTEDVLYLQKDGNYITYYLIDQKILARESIAEALLNLPENFIQVHKSFLINLNRVNSFDKDEIRIGDNCIPIGAHFKEGVFNKIKK